MSLLVSYHHSPIGWLQLQLTSEHLISLDFIETEQSGKEAISTPLLQQCCTQLDEYFLGNRKVFNLPIKQEGTVFQKIVWSQLNNIPFGKTISYIALAKEIGDANATRAVAAANGKNKIAVIVPCHRVIGSNAQLTGYSGSLWRKKWLLDHEATYFSGVQQFDF